MYSPIDAQRDETERSFGTSRSRHRDIPLPPKPVSSHYENINLSNVTPLLTSGTSYKPFDSDRKINISTFETEAEASDAYLDRQPHDQMALQSSAYRPWATPKPLSASENRTLRHKLFSSRAAKSRHGESLDIFEPDEPRKSKFTGWRAGTRLCCLAVALCIIAEVVLLIWAEVNAYGTGSGLLFESDCANVRILEVWLLLPLNIAATILIGTSNYVMQVMSAPTRKEIDAAHLTGEYMPLGGISFHSLTSSKRDRPRRIIWWILALSSVPIHLLLNVAFYSSVQVIDTGVLVVAEDFASDPTWDICNSDSVNKSSPGNFTCALKQGYMDNKTFGLSPAECKSQFARGFQTSSSGLIVVTDSNSSLAWYNVPVDASILPSGAYGYPCWETANEFGYGTGQYVINTTEERSFQFIYDPDTSSTSVIADPRPMCTNVSGDGVQFNIYILRLSYESKDSIFLRENDTLANITSIRSLFSAAEYPYWAMADISWDYLDSRLTTSRESSRWDTSSWVCPAQDLTLDEKSCDPSQFDVDSGWFITPNDLNVVSCHVLPEEEQCALRYSLKILIITMACDIVKLIAMVSAIRLTSNPLTTLGDIVESFLEAPDPYTKHRCLLDDDGAVKWTNRVSTKAVKEVRSYLTPVGLGWRGENRELWKGREMPQGLRDPTPFEVEAYHFLMYGDPWWSTVEPAPKDNVWNPRRNRWAVVPSKRRWWCLGSLYCILMLATVIYLVSGLNSISGQRVNFSWTMGFGGPDPGALWTGGLLEGTTSITWVAFLVNLPQLFFSTMYFILNATLTMMHTAREWGMFSVQRKALRVSTPRGKQRGTYWLQLPWSYSIPLIIASSSLHWLLGRSIYLVKIDVTAFFNQRIPEKDFFACGYSPITVLLLIVVLGLLGATLLLLSTRKIHPGMPFARLNSLAIAAACHPDPEEKDVALQPVSWGVLDIVSEEGIPHCSFSAKEVMPLSRGVAYM